MSAEDVQNWLRKELAGNDVVLFMKGSKSMPQCGFSMQVAQILNHLGVDFTDVNVLEGADEVGGACDEQVGESGGDAGADEGGAVFLTETAVKTELLGFEGVAAEIGGHVEVVGAQAEGGAEDGFVEGGGGGVDQQVAAAGGADDGPQVAGVDRLDGNSVAQKAGGPGGVAVAAPDVVALAEKKLGEEGPAGAGAEDEDAHDERHFRRRRQKGQAGENAYRRDPERAERTRRKLC